MDYKLLENKALGYDGKLLKITRKRLNYYGFIMRILFFAVLKQFLFLWPVYLFYLSPFQITGHIPFYDEASVTNG